MCFFLAAFSALMMVGDVFVFFSFIPFFFAPFFFASTTFFATEYGSGDACGKFCFDCCLCGGYSGGCFFCGAADGCFVGFCRGVGLLVVEFYGPGWSGGVFACGVEGVDRVIEGVGVAVGGARGSGIGLQEASQLRRVGAGAHVDDA